MELHQILVIIATLTQGLVAGLFFTYTTLIMPGLGDLGDKDFIKAFKSIDQILQPNPHTVGTQPFFGAVFFGAIITLIASVVFGFSDFDGAGKVLITAAVLIEFVGVLGPTLVVNLPLNNKIQTYHVEKMNGSELKDARDKFERRWNNWNLVRTLSSIATFALLALALLRTGSN